MQCKRHFLIHTSFLPQGTIPHHDWECQMYNLNYPKIVPSNLSLSDYEPLVLKVICNLSFPPGPPPLSLSQLDS